MNSIKRSHILIVLFSLFVIWAALLVREALLPMIPILHIWMLVIDLFIVVICFRLLFSLQKNVWQEEVTYFPEDLFDSAKAAFIIDGYADNKDIVALLMAWGAKGLIRISINSGSIVLTRLQKIPKSLPDYQRHFFNELFCDAAIVKLESLNQKFYHVISESRSMITNHFNRLENHVYTAESLTIQKILSGIMALPYILCLIAANIQQVQIRDLSFFIAIIIMGFLIALSMMMPVKLLIQIIYHWQGMTLKEKITKTAIMLAFSICIISFFTAYTFISAPLLSLFSLVVTILLSTMIVFSRKRTPQGQEWNNRLLALKKFMLEASEDTIIRLHSENPLYYFETLPYAYTMGISREWSNLFACISMPEVLWFQDNDTFPASFPAFHESLYKHFEDIIAALTSLPQKPKSFGARAR